MRRDRHRVGIEPRRVARARTLQQLSWQRAVALGAGVVPIITLLVGTQALLAVTGIHMGPGLFGFVLGCGLTSAAWAIWEFATSTDGSWSWRVGAQAERWTAEEVRRLGRRWRFRYNMVFVGGGVGQKTWVTDIDCVATGPHGVLAVSTKWTGDAWNLDNPQDDWLIAAAKQASLNATKLRRQVSHAVPNAPVVPLVVCWGPLLAPIGRGVSRVTIEGAEVLVVYGPQAREWLATFDAERLSDTDVSAIDAIVGDFIDRYEDLNARTPIAKSQAQLAARRSAWATRAGAVATIGAITWLVAASVSPPVLRIFTSFTRLGEGLVGVLFILVPTALLTGSVAFALKSNSWSARARVATDNRRVLIGSIAGLGTWLITLVLVLVTG